jgi:hypothetical protein
LKTKRVTLSAVTSDREKRSSRIALVGPTAAVARSFEARLASRFPDCRLASVSLSRFLSDGGAPARIVLCPAGGNLSDDLAFLRAVCRRALWPAPGAELWGAIAGLRGSHAAAPDGMPLPAPTRSGRRTALLLEGDVTPERARGAAEAPAPRHWIVERVQRVRIGESLLEELRRLGIRWSVLQPVEVVAVAVSPELARAHSRWSRSMPRAIPIRVIARTK